MASDLFRRQLGVYAAVHRDRRNKATHFIGIPVIVFSLLLILSLWPTVLLVVAVVAVLGWLALDLGIGLVMAVLMAIACYAAWALADNIFQGFIGPMFLVAETMVMMGQRTDLAEIMGDIDVTVE